MQLRRAPTIVVLAALFAAAPSRPSSAEPKGGAVCVYRQKVYPSGDGLPPAPMPRGVYTIGVDDRPPVELSPDFATLIGGLDLARAHRITLARRGKRIASAKVRLDGPTPVCVGMQEAGSIGVWRWWSARTCGCAK